MKLDWKEPDVEGLVDFLVRDKGFMCVVAIIPSLHGLTIHVPREDRVRKSCEKLTKAVNSKQQGRIDGFFTVKPKENTASSSKSKTKGGKDDSKTKSTKRKVRSPLRRCRVSTDLSFQAEDKEGGGAKKTKTKK